MKTEGVTSFTCFYLAPRHSSLASVLIVSNGLSMFLLLRFFILFLYALFIHPPFVWEQSQRHV